MESDAVISDCGTYRYWLYRRWGPGRCAVFCMLNPSTADAEVDDPTIRRCINFAAREGCDAMVAVNLYAYRATDPVDMLAAEDPVGPDNDAWIDLAVAVALADDAPVIAAWGSSIDSRRGRAFIVASRHPWMCLGVTKTGDPRHPLYLKADAPLIPWEVPNG